MKHTQEWIDAKREDERDSIPRAEDSDCPGCEECCEHGDVDEGDCLDCGKDLREELSARAYDDAKGRRQDADC